MVDGSLGVITNDVDLLHMWGHIVAVKGVYHLYVEPHCNRIPNKEPTTPTKKGSNNVNKSTSSQSPRSQIRQKGWDRRLPRLRGKFKSRFTSTKPIILFDNEKEEHETVMNEGEKGSR